MRRNARRRAVDRSHKEAFIASVEKIVSSPIVIVAHFQGMTVKEITDLRRQARAVGAAVKVTKNTLARRALKGKAFEKLGDLFTGATAVIHANDSLAAAKVVVNYAKDNEKLVILGAALDEAVIDVSTVKTLASLPSLDALRAKLLGLLNAPATKIAGVLQAPAGQLARVISAFASKG